MGHKTEVTASQSLLERAKARPLASERLKSGHAALVLGVASTLVYIISALVAFFASYTPGIGREKLSLMLAGILLPLALAVIVRRRIETVIGMLGVTLALACMLVGVAIFLVQGIDRGAAAGSVAVLLPLAGCGIVWAMTRQYHRLLLALYVCLLVAAACVLFSNERSAILGLIFGSVLSIGIFWRYRVAAPSPWLRLLDTSTLILLLLGVGIYMALILAPERVGQLGVMLPEYYAQRFALWRTTPAIIQDYMYTGSGLGASPMVLSSYLFLIHVPYYYHIHNLFLQVGIEQGIPGIIGLTGMFVAAFWSMMIAMRRAHAYLALCAVLVFAALLSLFVSGLFESDVYAGGWIVSMFLPFGFAWLIGQYDVSLYARRRRTNNRLRRSDILVGMLPLAAVLVLVAWPGSDAQWLANQGALAQTRIELSQFRFPLNKIQDEVRRNPEIDLEPAIQLYRAALVRNPNNVSALRRLAQIELSRGAYEGAQHKLETAYQVAPEQRATRQMLGEIYAIMGNVESARELWATVENGADLLSARLWWHRHIGDAVASQRIGNVLEQLNSAAQE